MTVKCILYVYLVFSLCIFYNDALDANDMVIIILSQKGDYHLQLATDSWKAIQKEANALGETPPIIYISHIDFQLAGDWTIMPLIPKLRALHPSKNSWFIFVEERTEIRLQKLLEALRKYNESEDIFLGYALFDKEATIIHHFAFYQDPQSFKFPNFASGFAISSSLLEKLAKRLDEEGFPMTDFSIDNTHELASFVWQKGKGSTLIHDSAFCVVDDENCSTVPKPFESCDKPVPIESLYFVVKTCSKFHNDRIPIVKKTWAIDTSKIDFFSDLQDQDIPTIDLGIPNTKVGHCGKTIAILKYADKKLKSNENIKWLVLADDDTLLSVPRLRKLLSCYDSTTPMVLGERYGYNVLNPEGYNYITGGGGIVFSRKLVEILTLPGICECPSISTPDDMFLGICIDRVSATTIHSPFFHQARPVDYPKDYLKTQMLVSFHKHWAADPYSIYNDWLKDNETYYSDNHTEL